jgi:hypothetical protein
MAVSGQDIVDYLLQFKGVPYVWGGTTPSGFDCSGLIQYGFKKFGINLPRVTYDQIGQGEAVGLKGLRVGDLVFFDTDKNTAGADHVGIYMGNGKMFHTPRPGKSAEIVDMTSSSYYMDRFMGGRRIAGVVSPGASSNDAPSQAEVKMTPEELAASYGWAYGFLNGNPELKKLFKEAVAGTWTADKFQAELRDTKWWKKTSDTARQAELMKSTDPATYQAQQAAVKLQVQQLAAQVGAAVPASKLNGIVESVIKTGLDEDGMRNILGQYVTFTKEGTLKGEAGMHEFTMKQFAAQNGVELTDQAVKNQAQLVIRKLATTQDFESQIREQAKSAFPGYADQLDAGMTMKDIASPYEQLMQKELELPSNPDGLNNQLIRTALNGKNSDGKPTGLSLSDFQSQLRNDPRWRQTSNAQDQVMNIGSKVLQDLGLLGG